MNPEKITTRTREALLAANQLARAHNHGNVLPEHLGLALLGQQNGVVYPLLDAVGADPLELRRQLESDLDAQPKVYGDGELTTSPQLGKVLNHSDELRASMGDDYLSVEHLMLALADTLRSRCFGPAAPPWRHMRGGKSGHHRRP